MQRYGWLVAWLICMTSMGLGAIMRTVDIGGTGQYTSIQSAVTASSPGDTVLVYPGRYIERVWIQTNSITLISMEAITSNPSYIDSTIIDGNNSLGGLIVFSGKTGITIRGFSLTGSLGSAISLLDNSISSIKNCKMYSNIGYSGAGINIFECTTYLSGLEIYDNYAYGLGGGVYIYGYMGTVSVVFDPINRCSIYNNTAGAGQDIVAHSINNDLSIPLNMFTVPNPSSYYAAAHRAIDNEFRLLIDAHSFHHQELESDLYVSPEGDDANDGFSPATALKTIKTAIYRVASDSLNQRTVHVLPGTYSRTANQQVFPIALKSWVRVKGAGIDVTNIVGEMDPAFANLQNSSLSIFNSFHQTSASLEDMSITSSGSSNSYALSGYKEDRLQLRNLRMHDLRPNLSAIINITYAIDCFWDGLIIENFTTERMGFIYNDGYISGVIRNSVFRNASSTFVSDEVWAVPLIRISMGENIIIENSVFANLTMADDDSPAIQFGGMYNPTVQQYYTFRNCIFSDISCNERAVLFHGKNYPIMNISNCTFAGHSGSGEALMVNGVVTISNSIFYSGRSVEIAINPMDGSGITSTLTLNNNLIKDGFSDIWQAPGNTIHYMDSNIEGNPLFLGGENLYDPLNYRLSASSPCIDSGTLDTTMLGLLPYDLARNHRIHNGRIDMGVYEYGAEPWVGLDDPLAPMLTGYSLYAYPNPFSVFANIRVALPTALNKGVAHFHAASIQVYNVKGQRVKSIALESSNKTEQYSYWDGRDDGGKNCPNGIYFLRLMLDGSTETVKKISLIRR